MKARPTAVLVGALAACAFVGLCIAVSSAWPPPGRAASPTDTASLPAGVDRQHFYEVVVPRARQEGSVNLYSFAPAFPPFWKQVVIPRFEARWGIKVHLFNTRADLADRQIGTLHALGQRPPVDVYFAPGSHMRRYRQEGIAADFDLGAMLPEAAAYSPALLARTAHDGRFVPFHLNQTALAYDSTRVPIADVPHDFDTLLAWARAHPRQFAFTSPKSGGSGEGLMLAIANRSMNAACRATLNGPWNSEDDAHNWVASSGCMAGAWQYLRALTAVSVMTNGNADTQNLLANEAVMIGTVWEDWAYTFIRAKLLQTTVRLTVPAPGMPGSADVLFVVAGAAHPAAALLFIDFALSRPIQQRKLDDMASRSARVDLSLPYPKGDAAHAGDASNFMTAANQTSPSIGWPSQFMMNALDRAFVTEVMERQ